MTHYNICLSVAGSDPSGGAGIQADLKTFSALGCYGATVITAITVQNTCGVSRSVAVDGELVRDQMLAVLSDLSPKAVKIGMTPNADIISHIAHCLTTHPVPFVVLDPIIRSSSGHPLIDTAALETMCRQLLPLVNLLTPNLDELKCLSDQAAPVEAAREIISRFHVPAILVKGGHAQGAPTDMLVTADGIKTYEGRRVDTKNDHGTGCTLSSAIAAYVASGHDLPTSVGLAKQYVGQALAEGRDVCLGQGHGGMNHFFAPLSLRKQKN
ncbi:MAG: bifunctional hydroxymethylpyrimidine kinase/phosphomethylpyrimidine kinase [Alloprevotella sp.]